jgi:hypothetical protein
VVGAVRHPPSRSSTLPSRARCSASYQAIPQASGRFRFPRHTGSKALATALPCSVPADAGKTDAGDCDRQPRLAVCSRLRHVQSSRHPSAARRRLFQKLPLPLQITPIIVNHGSSVIYNTVILAPMKNVLILALAVFGLAGQTVGDGPQFTPDGQLTLPKDYR